MERPGIRTAGSNGAYGHMIKFGTGGWRAVIGDDFTRENLCRVAQAVSDMLHEDEPFRSVSACNAYGDEERPASGA